MPKWAIVTFEKSFQVVAPDDATEEQAIQSAIKYHNEDTEMDDLYMSEEHVSGIHFEEDDSLTEDRIDHPEIFKDGQNGSN